MLKPSLLIVFSVIACLSPVLAQDYFTLFDANYEYSPSNEYKREDGSSADIYEMSSNLSLPIQRKNGEAFLIGFGYNSLSLHTQYINTLPTALGSLEPEQVSFYTYRFQLGYKKNFSDKFNMVTVGMLRTSSDEIDFERQDWQYGGAVFFSKTGERGNIFKYGLYLNTDFFGLFVVPLIGCDWKYSERVRIFGLLPANMTIQYKQSERLRFGLRFEAPTFTYRYGNFNGIYVNADGESPYVQNSKNALYFLTEIYLTKNLVIQLRAGRSVFRRIRFFHADETTPINVWGIGIGSAREDFPSRTFGKLEDGWLLNAGLAFRISLD